MLTSAEMFRIEWSFDAIDDRTFLGFQTSISTTIPSTYTSSLPTVHSRANVTPLRCFEMRPTIRFLANPVTNLANPVKSSQPLAILPPIPLYRRLLRTHRKRLGPEERIFGDEYVKSEFRRHKDIDNPLHIIGFLTQWQLYAQKLEGDAWKGEKLDKELVDKMSDQQVGQLYELMQAIQKRERDEVDAEVLGDEDNGGKKS